ncbi:MAG: 3-oxoadipate enol-lactonase, partial [Actinomycetota bacterium]
RDRLGGIAVPTLVVVGSLDEETPPAYAEALAAGIPGARLEVLAGAGHFTPVEAPAALGALLRDHVRAVEQP